MKSVERFAGGSMILTGKRTFTAVSRTRTKPNRGELYLWRSVHRAGLLSAHAVTIVGERPREDVGNANVILGTHCGSIARHWACQSLRLCQVQPEVARSWPPSALSLALFCRLQGDLTHIENKDLTCRRAFVDLTWIGSGSDGKGDEH